jgi:hypothetical protein
MLLHCDLRIAAEKAVMGPTWVRNGIISVMGGFGIPSIPICWKNKGHRDDSEEPISIWRRSQANWSR